MDQTRNNSQRGNSANNGNQEDNKFFITETNLGGAVNLKHPYFTKRQLLAITESGVTSDSQQLMKSKRSAFDYTKEVDELKSNLLTEWQKTIRKLNWPLDNYNYYDTLPVKPGVSIYKALIESKFPLKLLKINIPETLCVFNGLFWITTNQNGSLEVKSNDFLPRNFYDKIKEIQELVYNGHWLDPLHAAVKELKWTQFPTIPSKSFQTWEKFNETINYGPDADSILQQYIYSSAGKASEVRLFYFNPSVHPGQSQTYGYYISNKMLYLEGQNQGRGEERFTVSASRKNSFDYFVMKGKVLEPYEQFASQLVNFLYKSYGLRIESIAIDFTKDEREVIYFLDVVGFKISNYEKVSRLALLTDDQQHQRKQESKDIFDKANNTVQCQLCRLCYKKSEVTKIVTHKMLYELKNHLQRRGIFKFDYLDKYSESTQSCKVCDICYMLVVAEHELIEVEKLYAISQNIPLQEISKKIQEVNKVNYENIRSKLTQWRLLFYFQELQDIQIQALKSKCTSGKLYLQIKLFDYQTTLELDNLFQAQVNDGQMSRLNSQQSLSPRSTTKVNQTQQKESQQSKMTPRGMSDNLLHPNQKYNQKNSKISQIILKKLRIHFFFVEEVESLRYFLENTEVEFRITDGPKWNKPIAFASAYPFTHFNVPLSKDEEYVQRQNILLHFFGIDADPFQLLATTGLKKDHDIKTERITLFNYNKVYFPENTYYNSDPLPIEWLELFESREYFLDKFRKEEDETKNLGFTPFCSIKELNYMEPDFKGRWNIRQEAIVSGLSKTRQIVEDCTERLYPKSMLQNSGQTRSQSASVRGRSQRKEPIRDFNINEDIKEHTGIEESQSISKSPKLKKKPKDKDIQPMSKAQLKKQIDQINQMLQYQMNTENSSHHQSANKNYEFKIKTKTFNKPKHKAQPHQDSSKGYYQDLTQNNEQKHLKKQRAFSAKYTRSLLTTLGENITNTRSRFDDEPTFSKTQSNLMSPYCETLPPEQQTIKEDFQEDEDAIQYESRKVRPLSNYTSANFKVKRGSTKNQKFNVDAMNQQNNNPQSIIRQENRSLKRPVSAAFLGSQGPVFMRPAQLESIKQIFQIYDSRPPSGFQSIVSKKEKRPKKAKKRCKLKHNARNEQNGLQQPDTFQFINNQQFHTTSGKIVADHRLGAQFNSAYQQNPVFRPTSSESTQLTSERMSQLSQNHFQPKPNQYFSEILQQQHMSQRPHDPSAETGNFQSQNTEFQDNNQQINHQENVQCEKRNDIESDSLRQLEQQKEKYHQSELQMDDKIGEHQLEHGKVHKTQSSEQNQQVYQDEIPNNDPSKVDGQ